MRILEYIAYAKQGENHGTMILDGVCYSGILFGRAIIYGRRSPPEVSLFTDAYLG